MSRQEAYAVVRTDIDPPESVRLFIHKDHARRYRHEHEGEYTINKHRVNRAYEPTPETHMGASEPDTVFIVPPDWETGQGSTTYHFIPDCKHLNKSRAEPTERSYEEMKRSRKTPCGSCFPDELIEDE